MPGKQPQSDDQRLQSWLSWYDRNQAKSEYRRNRYAMLTEQERESIRESKRALYKRRITEGWHGPYRKNAKDNVAYRAVIYGLLVQRDGPNCGICGKEVEKGQESIDHIIPVNMGGSNEPNNVRLAHRSCNNRRPKKPKDIRLALEATTETVN